MANPITIRGAVDRFEEKFAVIITETNSEIFWPIKNLPEELSAGNAVRLTLSTNDSEQEDREALVKSMLNDILNNAPSQDTNSR